MNITGIIPKWKIENSYIEHDKQRIYLKGECFVAGDLVAAGQGSSGAETRGERCLMDAGKPKHILLHPADNVIVAAKEIAAGQPAGIRGHCWRSG